MIVLAHFYFVSLISIHLGVFFEKLWIIEDLDHFFVVVKRWIYSKSDRQFLV